MAKKRSSSFYISVYITSVDWCASDILAGHDFSVAVSVSWKVNLIFSFTIWSVSNVISLFHVTFAELPEVTVITSKWELVWVRYSYDGDHIFYLFPPQKKEKKKKSKVTAV